MHDVTAIVKTFKRDDYMRRCVSSLRKEYPEISIIVVDDGKITKEKRMFCKQMGAEYVELPFDGGLPRGRNEAMKRVKTQYVLIGDDDFDYTPTESFSPALRRLRQLIDICDIAGGRVIEGGEIGNYQGMFSEECDGKQLKWTALDLENIVFERYADIPFVRCHFTYNFFVARTEVVRSILWDENIKVAYEHSDFFISAWRKGARVVFCPDAFVTHKPSDIVVMPEKKKEYGRFRFRKSDRAYFLQKWGYTSYLDVRGFLDRIGDSLPRNEWQRQASSVFESALHALEESGVKFWIQDGTLLGAIRDGDFIPHDSDIDFGMFAAAEDRWKLIALMYRAGFKEKDHFGTPDNGYEISFEKDGVKVDFFWFYQKGNTAYHCAWRGRDNGREQLFYDYPKSFFSKLSTVEFQSFAVPAPRNPEAFLEHKYGEWHVVKKNWDWADDPLCRRK